MVEGKTPADMPGVLAETFSKTIAESRALPGKVGTGYYALDEAGRVRRRAGCWRPLCTGWTSPTRSAARRWQPPEGIALTARILDELLARRTVSGRPADLGDDMAWVRAASGRSPHPDPRLPLIG